MPFVLEDIIKQTSKPSRGPLIPSAKFFHKSLTGAPGKQTGLLGPKVNPATNKEPAHTPHEGVTSIRRVWTSGNTETRIIPTSPLSDDVWDAMANVCDCMTPAKNAMVKIASLHEDVACQRRGSVYDVDLYLSIEPHAIITEKTRTPGATKSDVKNVVTPVYLMKLLAVDANIDFDDPIEAHCWGTLSLGSILRRANKGEANLGFGFTARPRHIVKELFDDLEDRKKKDQIHYGGQSVTIFEPQFNNWFSHYSLVEHVARLSEVWQTNLADIFNAAIECRVVPHLLSPNFSNDMRHYLEPFAHTLRLYEQANVPLETYKAIYDGLKAKLPKKAVDYLSKQNLNLLLSNTLSELSEHTAELSRIPNVGAKIDPFFSAQQKDAISAPESLVLVQSVAGSGKSTSIKGRIDYLVDSGIDPTDIMVISFTNAAADNISEKLPDIHSMTIAKMIHQIYVANFPTHQLSNTRTLLNTIDIKMKSNLNDPFIIELKERLRDLELQEKGANQGAVTKMNNFIEANFNEFIAVLNRVEQTTLEIEIMVCYQQIDNLTEPAEVQSKHLIVDEVQDDSIFEFIYTLKYVAKHKESLYFVGDASQTLYEFRSSNPRALNVLEMSGVFHPYKLDTNYRTDQELLDFANIHLLSNLESNRIAQLELQSNDLRIQDPVTPESFGEKVALVHTRVPNARSIKDRLPGVMHDNFADWAKDKLDKGEQIALLAHTRDHAEHMARIAADIFPNAKIESMIPDRAFSLTPFTEFIKHYWTEIKFAPSGDIIATIKHELIDKRAAIIHARSVNGRLKQEEQLEELIDFWLDNNQGRIRTWEALYKQGAMSQDELLEHVCETLIASEMEKNAIHQSVLAKRNADRKNNDAVKNADIVYSTIHSAKGLEFDNVCLLYNSASSLDEADKRMYYVALTRAKNAELILSFDTRVKPAVVADYDTTIQWICARLNANAAPQSSAA